jgi:hypothetical protein
VALLLAGVAAALLLLRIHDFSQQRFFTIDEYQFGHATWSVSQGEVPYRDFYEHHFPMSYIAHAPLLRSEGGFDEKALRLRDIAFVYLVLASALVALGTAIATRSPLVAVLSAVLPLGFGFSLMSEVEYRADNFGAALLLCCLSLLEANRRWRRRAVAALCGALLAASVLMTQKMIYFGGGSLSLMLAADFLRRRRSVTPLVAHPLVLVLAAGGLLFACVAAAAALGILGQAFDLTIADAIRHEWTYQRVPIGRFLPTFLRETGTTTALILACAGLHLLLGRDRFWWFPTAAVLLGGSLIRAQYPYNYVLAGWLIVLCAIRGYDDLLQRIPWRGAMRVARPLFYLAPLLLLPDQLGFVSRAASNEDQLRLMRKIERFTGEGDAVIDGAGGGLFRPHASYFYYHGGAQRQLFADYFARELVEDYRRSRAPFWIRDVRLRSLPDVVQRYFRDHYVRADGDLYALGFRLPSTSDRPKELDVDVVRPGRYRVLRAPEASASVGDVGSDAALTIGGRPLEGAAIWLDVGRHRVEVPAGRPAQILTPLPEEVFDPQVGPGAVYSPLLDYGQ